ncbi:hypothetical protein Poli38472_000366 [Pythium oligandrum]|uniref:BZIP domain-containing protein n=1 Tax=Pythium oligandrum TaxID=41045 RepID=A0A8K1CBI5_PYTOL|nr:hypothetical protein Poli38472_000366 [Pythium oligandrum]|eukprot:TMW60324.1 hypothetical protein Poli38472_000366 [Pythium oligandrum]
MAPNPTTTTATTQLHATELGSGAADLTAEMELLGGTNRDMFSWLLFNSENMTASMTGAGATGAAASHAMVNPLSSHHQPLDSIDDPFRMLPHDDASLPLSLAHPSAPLSTGVLTSVPMTTVTSTAAPLGISAHLSSPASSVASHPNTPLATATAGAPGSLQVNVQVTGGDKGAAAKRRGKKRPAEDSPSHASKIPTPVTPNDPTLTVTGVSTQNLLRHLQSANQNLMQKQASGMDLTNQEIKQERSSSSGSESPDRLRKLKLERNRESARECRRRKREHILGVEERCRQLERENMELRGQLKAGKEAMKQEEREKNRVCEELEQMIQRGASEKELAEKIDNFKEQYSDYGHGRRSALDYHLHQIERLLLPTQVTKMCIWALRQDDSFWHDDEDDTSLPAILARELGLSEEQKKKIQQQRAPFLAICDNLKTALGLLNELKTQVASKNTTLDMEMDKLQNILTPTQRAKFIVWVTNNQACMHLLNKLWRSVL